MMKYVPVSSHLIVDSWWDWLRWIDVFGDYVDVVFLAASNNLLKFMPDTLIGLTDCHGQGPNVVFGHIESLADV